MFYITGDTHGQFERIEYFCYDNGTTKQDTLIILGDVGINYYGGKRDLEIKNMLAKLPITLFCIKGNHEQYAGNLPQYDLVDWNDGKVYVEYEFPNLLFAKDGEIYNINGQKTIVIGGAYSVDKYFRLERGYNWFADEQPSEKTKQLVEQKLKNHNWEVNLVLSHTCPRRYEPIEWFLSVVKQDSVDKSTENWLDSIFEKLNFNKWYCGHYHGEKQIDKIEFMFNSIKLL